MARALFWMKVGLCTGLGLVVIGLAAVSSSSDPSGTSSTPRRDGV
ncbi:MAG TPA: hypothetical protein PLW10_16620 [Myxococcota bacterium]|nr:hypothetical protein [Myxococcota bacterium]